ncbi:MAG: hypothetical protein EB090_03270 [Verrucomicrobia bacterium]|nr:hypothetical protein [Verrucomicrobiota bacterium]
MTQDPFEDLGDLLEALGRRRHESPPPPVLPTPAAIPAQPPAAEMKPVGPFIPPIPTVPAVVKKTKEIKKAKRPASREPVGMPLRSRLRDAVVLSEILAPPLALR